MNDRMTDAKVLDVAKVNLALAKRKARIFIDNAKHEFVVLRPKEWGNLTDSFASLIARNAELRAQTPCALAEKLRSCEQALAAAEAERDALRDALYNIVELAERFMTFDENSRFGIAIAEANKLLPRAEASHA